MTQSDDMKLTTASVFGDRKRKNRPEDDIDALFNERLGKTKKVSIAVVPSPSSAVTVSGGKVQRDLINDEDRDLEQVLGAIRLAPKGGFLPKRNKAKKSHHVSG